MNEQRPTRSTPEGLRAKDLGDEYLFFDQQADRVHVLNGTAREIYLLCDGERSVGQVAGLLAERYGVEPSTATRDTEQTIRRLVELGLVSLV